MIDNNVDVKFHINEFEGPLDLLLHLIRKNKLDILDISLVEITDQYINYIDEAKDLNLDLASDYLVIASQLLEMKSKFMLKQEIFMDEIEDEEEASADLIKKLIEYEKYKKASSKLADIFEKSPNLEKEDDEFIQFIDDESDKVINLLTNGLSDFKISIDNIVQRIKDNRVIETKIHLTRISPEERRDELRDEIFNNDRKTFVSVLHSPDRYYIAVSLLVLLEMANSGEISLRQKDNFEDIEIIKTK